MPYSDSSKRFSQELESIRANARALQSELDAARELSLSSAENAFKKEYETRAKYDAQSLKSTLESSKKAQAARKSEAQSFIAEWENAMSQSKDGALSAGDSVLNSAAGSYSSYVEYAKQAYESCLNMIAETSAEGGEIADKFASQWSNAFSRTRSSADGFKGFMQRFFRELGEESANAVLDLINAKTKDSPFGSIFKVLTKTIGGFFAEGGRPPTGKISVVGEQGPELFVPDSAGTIIPNDKLGGAPASINVNQYFSFQSLDPVTNMRMLEQQKSQIQQWVAEGIRGNQNNLRNAVNGA